MNRSVPVTRESIVSVLALSDISHVVLDSGTDVTIIDDSPREFNVPVTGYNICYTAFELDVSAIAGVDVVDGFRFACEFKSSDTSYNCNIDVLVNDVRVGEAGSFISSGAYQAKAFDCVLTSPLAVNDNIKVRIQNSNAGKNMYIKDMKFMCSCDIAAQPIIS